MSNRTLAEQADLESLRTEYRDAFENWATQIDRLHEDQDSEGQNGSTAEEQASADAAETTYRGARDRLAAEMVHQEETRNQGE
jgi:hypothetical protein